MKNGPFFLNNLIIYSSNFAMYIGWKVMRKYVCIRCSKIQKKSSKWGFVQSADFLPYRLPCSNTKFCTFYSLQSTATTGIPIHTTEKPPYLRPQDTREKMFSSFWLGKQYSCAARGAEERFPIIRLDGARRHCLPDSPDPVMGGQNCTDSSVLPQFAKICKLSGNICGMSNFWLSPIFLHFCKQCLKIAFTSSACLL